MIDRSPLTEVLFPLWAIVFMQKYLLAIHFLFLNKLENCFVGDQDRSICEKRVREHWLGEEVGGGGKKRLHTDFRKEKKKNPAGSYSWLQHKQLSAYKVLAHTMPACEKEPSEVTQGHRSTISGWKDSGKMRPKRIRVIRLAFFHHLMLYQAFLNAILPTGSFKCMHPWRH